MGNVSEIEETARLMRYLHESVQDHGGTIAHINRLLGGERRNSDLLAQVAKLLVGEIWYHVEHSRVIRGLSLEDFELSADEFLAKWPGVEDVRGGNGFDTKAPFTEAPLPRGGAYRLMHFEKPMKFHEILDVIPLMNRAGWRELVAYVATMSTEAFSGCQIIAPGSHTFNTFPDGSVQPTSGFPEAYNSALGDGKPHVIWHSKKRPLEDKYPTSCFYLVRCKWNS